MKNLCGEEAHAELDAYSEAIEDSKLRGDLDEQAKRMYFAEIEETCADHPAPKRQKSA